VTERILAQGEERGAERCRMHRDRRETMNRSPCPRTRLKLPGAVLPDHAAPKGARRFAVARARPLVCVAVLARSAATRCTPLLASEHARAITTGQTHVITL